MIFDRLVSYNRSLVRGSETRLFSHMIFLIVWFLSLRSWIKQKRKNHSHSQNYSYSLLVTSVTHFIYLPYWQTEGIITATEKRLPSNPSYGNICKRINRLNINIKKIELDAKSLHFSMIYTKS